MTQDQQDVERLLRDDHEAMLREAKVPSAGAVYWRASIRARSEAALKAERPLTVVQGLAAAAVAGVGVALGGFAWRSLGAFETSERGLVAAIALGVAALVVISPLAMVALGGRVRFDPPQD